MISETELTKLVNNLDNSLSREEYREILRRFYAESVMIGVLDSIEGISCAKYLLPTEDSNS